MLQEKKISARKMLRITSLSHPSNMFANGGDERCSYFHKACNQPRLEGYEFCLKHILEDKNAPYKMCSYVYSGNGRRCTMPTPKGDRKDSNLCCEHSRKAQLQRQKSSRRHAPPISTESLLLNLSHYAKSDLSGGDEREMSDETLSLTDGDITGDHVENDSEIVTKALNPFVDIDSSKINSSVSRILDYASESDSDRETVTYEDVWKGREAAESDGDSIDSQQDDPLKHAGIYTAEEVTIIAKDKLIRLQSLYIEQFRRLQHELRERRRSYLLALKKEKETLSSIHAQSKESAKEQKLYAKLKALNRYHRRSGVEALVHKKSLERRAHATEGIVVRQPPSTKCVFTEGGVKCGEKTLPLAKHCRKHILEDSRQVLFRACACSNAGFQCREPVYNVFENASCIFHLQLAPLEHKSKVGKGKNEEKISKQETGRLNFNVATDVSLVNDNWPEVSSSGGNNSLERLTEMNSNSPEKTGARENNDKGEGSETTKAWPT